MTSTRDQIARGTRALLAVAAIASLGFDGDFVGCGGPAAPPSGPIPEGPRPECLVDDDCAELMCRTARCIASRCVASEVIVDADMDGEGAFPCGSDCDDRSPARSTRFAEVCDLIDNDCDDRVDEGTTAAFVSGQVFSTMLDVAPLMVDTTPGLLFVSNFAGSSLEARWVGTQSALIGIASIESANVGLARTRSLGGSRAEVVWSTTSDPVFLRRAVLRVVASASASILIESTETLATLPGPARELQLEGDALGPVVLVSADTTLMILPGQAPVTLPAPSAFDLAVVGDLVAIPGALDTLNFYDRNTGAMRGSFTNERPLSATDAVVSWGTRLFAFGTPFLTEIDPLTLRVLGQSDVNADTGTVFGATTDELVFVDSSLRVRGLDAMFGLRTHALLTATLGGRRKVFELGSHVAFVSLDVGSATYQVEQCGD